MARVTVMTPILLMFCAKTHLMGELAAFIKYVTWLDFDTFIGFMQCWKQNTGLDFWQKLTLAGFAQPYSEQRELIFLFLYLFILFSSPYSSLSSSSSVLSVCVCVCTGYGFVDFDSPAAAQKAVASLKASGVQAQMAKVSFPPSFILWSALLVVAEVFPWCYNPGRLNHCLKTLQKAGGDDGWCYLWSQ